MLIPNSNTATPGKRPRIMRLLRLGAVALASAVIFTGIFIAARYITEDAYAQELVNQFGYVGVVITSFIAGLNAFVPVPAWSFVPIFTAAGLWMPLIILALVIGTTLADLLAFYVGVTGREFANRTYPKVRQFTTWLEDGKARYIVPFVFLYAAFSPLPNEIILVPLALAGVRLRVLLLPLILGTIVFQSAFALGAQGAFTFLMNVL